MTTIYPSVSLSKSPSNPPPFSFTKSTPNSDSFSKTNSVLSSDVLETKIESSSLKKAFETSEFPSKFPSEIHQNVDFGPYLIAGIPSALLGLGVFIFTLMWVRRRSLRRRNSPRGRGRVRRPPIVRNLSDMEMTVLNENYRHMPPSAAAVAVVELGEEQEEEDTSR